ncbi:MAG: hypothetical protein AABX51_00590, partial [Nanoarchaeota archaeon]
YWGEDSPKVHVVGTLVQLQTNQGWQQGMLDDGTGVVEFRVFNDRKIAEVGEQVRIIGKPKVFGITRYINVDIIKKIDNPSWLKVWQLEVGLEKPNNEEKVIDLIKKLDTGQGANIEDLISNSGIPNIVELVDNLKNKGDVFETRPGKIKVLE